MVSLLAGAGRAYLTDLASGGMWDVERKPVAFAFDSGLRYDLNASQAWAALVPGDGLVHLGAHAVTLGPRILRAETAPVALLGAIAALGL